MHIITRWVTLTIQNNRKVTWQSMILCPSGIWAAAQALKKNLILHFSQHYGRMGTLLAYTELLQYIQTLVKVTEPKSFSIVIFFIWSYQLSLSETLLLLNPETTIERVSYLFQLIARTYMVETWVRFRFWSDDQIFRAINCTEWFQWPINRRLRSHNPGGEE